MLTRTESCCICLIIHITCLRHHFNFLLLFLFFGDKIVLMFLLRCEFVGFFLFSFGQAGMRVIPKTVWLLACFLVNPNAKIPGPSKCGCTVIVFTTFMFDLPVSFLVLVHFLLALVIFPFCEVNLNVSCLNCTTFSSSSHKHLLSGRQIST